ncbi:Protein phosphatase 2C-like protein C10F6.17c [Golovinomyces cichoracearum]|uniref:Protein phosphatase 2C-like protein C10F6.17c n=1 Tax=Golovinomyces cichoracearum TaxID=62708 RepID=A0A420HJK5_9PEZI|nr:Protein phosphatase 2C-like protein C10F6.17c [Golovinomyces cichoracearum]
MNLPFRTALVLPKTCQVRTRIPINTCSCYKPYNYPSRACRPFFKASVRAKSMHIGRTAAAVLFGVVGYKSWNSYHSKTEYPGSGSTTTDSQAQPVLDRKVIVVNADSLYTGLIPGGEPISKRTDESGTKVVELLTPEQATNKLRRNEKSYLIGRRNGVERYDIVQIPSNDPIEDDHVEKIIEMPFPKRGPLSSTNSFSDWIFWGVFDGHSGWTTSAKLRQALIGYVARELNYTYQAIKPMSSPSIESIHAAIKTGFKSLDDEIVIKNMEKTFKANSKTAAAELLAPALSGSCALLSFYDSNSKLLHVACTGDSRAVLGRRGQNGKWVATPLSTDQTGSNPDEEARIRKEHPGEHDVIRNGRVLGGLEPTRAFGDAKYKWSREVSERLKKFFVGRTPSKLLQTPPYVTAEPVVKTMQIYPERNDFLVMATDGLWEMLSSEEVVGLVGKWIEEKNVKNNSKSWTNIFSSSNQNPLPVEQNKQESLTEKTHGQKVPIRQQQWGINREDERFVVQDKNAATHLVRNALGGKDSETLCALLSLPAPFSRRYRDDLTVQVIFFGETSDTSGKVVANKESTASANDIKARL